MEQLIEVLKKDVILHGGNASEIVNVHGQLTDITISSSPWGEITIIKPVSRLEAIALTEAFDPFK